MPSESLTLLTIVSLLVHAAYYLLDVDLQTALLIPSGAAVLVYVIGSGAGIRLLKTTGARRILPWMSLAISVAALPFVGPLALAAVITAAGALAYIAIKRPAPTARPSP